MSSPDPIDNYVRLVQHELSAEAFAGFQLAFMRPFAVPHLADILASSGSMQRDAYRRAYTTGLMMYEVIDGRLETSRALRIIAAINHAHRGLPATNEDFAYVLDSFIVVVTRHMDQMGWRTTTESERIATWRFYCRLADMMNIADPPDSFDHASERLDRYEAAHVRPSSTTRELGAATLSILMERLPRVIRPFAPQFFSVQLGAPRVAEALELPMVKSPVRGFVRGAGAVHGRLQAKRHATTPFFVPGQAAGRIFPDGYTLEELLDH